MVRVLRECKLGKQREKRCETIEASTDKVKAYLALRRNRLQKKGPTENQYLAAAFRDLVMAAYACTGRGNINRSCGSGGRDHNHVELCRRHWSGWYDHRDG